MRSCWTRPPGWASQSQGYWSKHRYWFPPIPTGRGAQPSQLSKEPDPSCCSSMQLLCKNQVKHTGQTRYAPELHWNTFRKLHKGHTTMPMQICTGNSEPQARFSTRTLRNSHWILNDQLQQHMAQGRQLASGLKAGDKPNTKWRRYRKSTVKEDSAQPKWAGGKFDFPACYLQAILLSPPQIFGISLK